MFKWLKNLWSLNKDRCNHYNLVDFGYSEYFVRCIGKKGHENKIHCGRYGNSAREIIKTWESDKSVLVGRYDD